MTYAYTCIYCGGGNARTPAGNGRRAHKQCIREGSRPRELALVPPDTQYRTVLAPNAPWPFPVSATNERST